MNIERTLSLVISLIYIAVSLMSEGKDAAVATLTVLCIPITLIWFDESIGSYTGWIGSLRLVDKVTPPVMIRFMGWLFLLAPLAVNVAVRLFHDG